jgi:hypothetical protein
MGAVHEPGAWSLKPFSDYAMDGLQNDGVQTYVNNLFSVIKTNARVVDPRLSLCAYEAMLYFPDAHWIILFRSPVDTCRSWLERRAWENNAPHRIRPIEGWLDWDEPAYKAGWTWNTMYRLCLANMTDKFEFWCADDDLDRVENKGPGTYYMDGWEQEIVWDQCADTYQRLCELRRDVARPVYDWYMGGRDEA